MKHQILKSRDYRVLSNFRYEIRRFLNFSEQAARHVGIEPHQHQALLAIRGLRSSQKPSIGVLAERLQIEHHSAVELVNRLERKHLIRRSRNATDRREVLLQLTARGERILRSLTRVHRAELRTAGPKLLRALKAAIAESRHSKEGKDEQWNQ
jgi:DNA-binding MarR family transcriptional regulator